jgi:hypothetical protein
MEYDLLEDEKTVLRKWEEAKLLLRSKACLECVLPQKEETRS